jgi:hypothetical protein
MGESNCILGPDIHYNEVHRALLILGCYRAVGEASSDSAAK